MNWLHRFFATLVDLSPVQGAAANTAHLQTIINTILSIMGATAVLTIVIAGFRYIVSQGSPNETAAARNAILYASIGLVVIIAAFAIVNFVVLGFG